MWLKEKGLEKFMDFEDVEDMPPLDEMAYWYPGEITNAINSYTLDVAERHVMKEGINRFKAAMSQLRLRTTTVVTKLLEYDRKFARDAQHYSKENILENINTTYMGDMNLDRGLKLAMLVLFVFGITGRNSHYGRLCL